MKFDIGTILSVTHGRLLTDIGKVYEILNFMLDDNLFTHQLPGAGRFSTVFILAQYPRLSEFDALADKITIENWKDYLQKGKDLFGEELDIEKVPAGVWNHQDPIDEAILMAGGHSVIVIRVSGAKEKYFVDENGKLIITSEIK